MRTQHLVNVSGGKDSTATYLRAIELGRPFRAVFADTGNEHPLTYEYVATLAQRTGGPAIETVRADFGPQMAARRAYIAAHWSAKGFSAQKVSRALELMRPSGNPFLDLCLLKYRFPASQSQFCTEELKIIPIIERVVLPMLKTGPVLQWLGIRAEEGRRRAKQPRYNRHESGCYLWRPIFNWPVRDVWAIHAKHGIAPNPLYALGFGRVGCFPCVNCNKKEFALIGRHGPEHLERVNEWAELVGEVSPRNRATFFPIKDTLTGNFWRNQPGGGCTSDLGICETEY